MGSLNIYIYVCIFAAWFVGFLIGINRGYNVAMRSLLELIQIEEREGEGAENDVAETKLDL